MRFILFTLICLGLSILLPVPALAYFAQKYEPADGRIIHGMGQYVTLYYTDNENWTYINQYVSSVGKTPAILSAYWGIAPAAVTLNANPNLYDLANNHGNQYRLMIGVALVDQDMTVPVTTILSGAWDPQIISLADSIKVLGTPTFVRPGFEFGSGNSGYHADKMTGAEYIAIWRHLRQVFANRGVTNVAWIWNTVNPDTFNYMDYYPGDDQVDWWGINYFTYGQMVYGTDFVNDAYTHHKPVFVSESNPIENNGTSNPANWNSWFVPYFSLFSSHPNLKGFIYISNPWNKPGFWQEWPDSRINTNPTILQNYSAQLSQPKFIHLEEYLASPSSTITPIPSPQPGDANGDGKIDGVDYTTWLINFGKQFIGHTFGDFNNNGIVDGIDYVIWLVNYN